MFRPFDLKSLTAFIVVVAVLPVCDIKLQFGSINE